MRLLAWGLLAVVACFGSRAHAEQPTVTKQICVDAYREAQPLSRSGALTKARALLLVCARDPCPPALQPDCVAWLDEVAQRMPTIVVTFRDESGRDVPDAQLTIDGLVVSPRLDGREIEVDPGEHVISVRRAGKEALVRRVVAHEREKGRELKFEPPEGTSPDRVRPLPWTFWTATAVAGVGLASFGVFGARGLSERSDLESCSPTCSDRQLQPARTNFLIADSSLGVAALAAGIATFLFFTRPPERRPSAAIVR